MRSIFTVVAVCLSFLFAGIVSGEPDRGVLHLRFLDSQTGYAIQPDVVVSGLQDGSTFSVDVESTGRAEVGLPFGDYTVTITSETHQKMAAAVALNTETPPLQFSLDPVSRPAQLLPEAIIPQHRPDATIFVGYIVGEESGQPLANVRVSSAPSGAESFSDKRGFFQIAVPLQDNEEWKASPAVLTFSKSGFQTQENRNLELWSNGDWIYRVRLSSGTGTNVVDQFGKRTQSDVMPSADQITLSSKEAPISYVTSPTNYTIRIPTNIRVLLTNGTVDYISMETYTARSLSQEWFSSWGNYSGGINSLKAGAVAVRSYAAWFVNNAASSSTYDICSTTSCQVYRQTSTSNGDTAATQTAGFVIVGSNNTITRSEYSAENNSLGFSCGDGFTQPTGGCIADPVCSGETRFGHGRGMCQWGTAKWATGLKIAGNGGSYPSNANSGVTNGYPKRDWLWIVDHYYPDLTLAQAKPLVIGDDVIIVGSTSRTNHICPDGGISSGVGCIASNFVKAGGSIGVITNGPVRVTSDGKGFTWWKVVWSDNQVGWIPENWLERIFPVPSAPTNLRVAAISTNQVGLTWSVDNSAKVGYRIERSINAPSSWSQIDDIDVGVTNYLDTTVSPATTNYYRMRAYNLGGNSPYSNTTNAVVPDVGPTLPFIADRTVAEQTTLTFTNFGSAPDILTPITDFESYADGASVLFRAPGFSGSTSTHLDTAVPNSALVSASFPADSRAESRVLKASWSFKTGTSNPWLRLTTAGATVLPNPVINFTKKLRFDIYTDKSLKLAFAARETTNAVGAAIGSDGGTSGVLEFVGVNSGATQPSPLRIITAGAWSTVTFNIPAEPAASFNAGNGVVGTASGLGVLENLAIVPNGQFGEYNVYLDNFAVAQPKTLTYSLDPGAPSGASVHPVTGIFIWTPTEAQGPGSYPITIRVSDNQVPAQSAARTFTVTVAETNSAPTLSSVLSRTVHVGNSVVITNSASDSDLPSNSLTFSLDPGAPTGSGVDSASGVFSWMPGDPFVGTTNSITVRVTDSGSPQLSATASFNVAVIARPVLQSVLLSGGNVNLAWSTIAGRSYKLQYKATLNDLEWSDVATVFAAGTTATYSEPVGNGQRYYRIIAQD